jgi:hypothetical protein
MKFRIITIISLVVLMAHHSFAQGDPNKTLHEQKLAKYKNMKNGGILLIVVGGILVIAGGAVELSQFEDSMSTMFTAEPEKEYKNTGAVLFCSGMVMAGAGIPLTIVGTKKYRYYKRNPDVISLGIKAHPQATGLSLTYRF